ncbi:MAG TPA: DUF2267 domain-containing protein [Micromonosporaceae bacterium]
MSAGDRGYQHRVEYAEFLDQVRLAGAPVPAEQAAQAVLGALGEHLPPGTAGYLAGSLPPQVAGWVARRPEDVRPDDTPPELLTHEIARRCGCPDEAAPDAIRAVLLAVYRAVPGGVMYKVRAYAPGGVSALLRDHAPERSDDRRRSGVAAGLAG